MMSFESPKKLSRPWIERNGRAGLDPDFGYKTKGSSSVGWGSGYLRGSKFQIIEDGTAESITIYLKGGTSAVNFRCLIYEDDAGYPGKLVASTETLEIAIDWDGWKTFSVISGGSLSKDKYYWLFGWSQGSAGGGLNAYYDAGDTNQITYWSATWNSPPDPFPSGGVQFDRKMSIYCSYTAGGGQTYEIYKDAVVKASAEKSLQTTYNIQKDAVVAGSAMHGEESTLNILKDAIVKSFTDLGVETTFCIEKEAIVKVLADVTVEKLAGQIIEIFKDAVVQAQASFSLESIFNVNKDALVKASAMASTETIFNVVKEAIVKASASPQVVRVIPINVDAVVTASATPSLQQTLGIHKDAVVVAVSTTLIQSTFNISPEAIVKVLAEVDVTKEKPEVVRLFLVLGLEHSTLNLALSHGSIDLNLETPYIIELRVD
jgi:hypothetical protein